MAKRKSNPQSSGDSSSNTRALEELIESQRTRIFQVMGIIETATKVLDADDEYCDPTGEQPVWWSLQGARDVLNDIAESLDSTNIHRAATEKLDGQVSHGQ